jgi:hypothetical protein
VKSKILDPELNLIVKYRKNIVVIPRDANSEPNPTLPSEQHKR